MSRTLKNGLPEAAAQRYKKWVLETPSSLQPQPAKSKSHGILEMRYGGTEHCRIGIEQFADLDRLLIRLSKIYSFRENTANGKIVFSIGKSNLQRELALFPEIFRKKWEGVYISEGDLYVSTKLVNIRWKYTTTPNFEELPLQGEQHKWHYRSRARFYQRKGGAIPYVLDEDLAFWDVGGIIKKRNHLKEHSFLQDWE